MFDYDSLIAGRTLAAAALQFETQGFIVITGIERVLADRFKPLIAERLGVDEKGLEKILAPDAPAIVLPEEIRERLARIHTPPELADGLVGALQPLLRQLIGPFVHVSNGFHGQFKGDDTQPIDRGGYREEAKFLEVHRPYLVHQDFTGGSVPTSPAGLTLWTPLNSCPDWNVRFWPGSHRHGLLCQRFQPLDDPRLEAFARYFDFEARAGTAVIFNALLLHSSSNPGPRRRVSCDIRFFPLTGFLPTQPRLLDGDPVGALHAGLERGDGPTLSAPLREALAFLGQGRIDPEVPPLSILNWANYVTALLTEGPDAARPHLDRFVNAKQGWEPAEAYYPRLHNRPVYPQPLPARVVA
ncbi:MAG: phytanoyl-CoA dioxygenase family protein [Gemmatimonadota bacterium]